jgi:hypothetical protein
MATNFSVKNYSPSYLAKPGYYSMTESFILQFLSSDKSFNAGTIDCYKFSNPITLFNSSSFLNKLSRTSLDSSLRRAKNIGSIWSFVGPFSIIGHTDKMFSARACLTYVN